MEHKTVASKFCHGRFIYKLTIQNPPNELPFKDFCDNLTKIVKNYVFCGNIYIFLRQSHFVENTWLHLPAFKYKDLNQRIIHEHLWNELAKFPKTILRKRGDMELTIMLIDNVEQWD